MKKLLKIVLPIAILCCVSLSMIACTNDVDLPESHKFCEWYVSAEVTCTENGEERRDCTTCRHYETRVIEAVGHNIEQHEAKEPTHLEVGYEAYEYCTNCDYTTKVEIPMIEHEFTTEVIAPTCTEKGYTTHICECGFVENTDYVDELGHNYEVETTEPTCEENGLSVYTCACGDTYEEVLEATGHKESGWILDEQPTTETEGSMHKECEHCGIKMEEDKIAPIE